MKEQVGSVKSSYRTIIYYWDEKTKKLYADSTSMGKYESRQKALESMAMMIDSIVRTRRSWR